MYFSLIRLDTLCEPTKLETFSFKGSWIGVFELDACFCKGITGGNMV